MDALGKIRDDWRRNHAEHEGQVEGEVWGYQWGHQEIIDQMTAVAGPHIYGRVLEIGCGAGKWTKWLFNYATSVDAIDVHDVAIVEAKAYEPRARYFVTSGDGIPRELGKYDVVFSYDVMLHLPPFLVAKYMLDALYTAKHFLFDLPDINSKRGADMFIQAVGERAWERLYSYGFMNYYAVEQVKSMLSIMGWKRIQTLGLVGAPQGRDMVYLASKE